MAYVPREVTMLVEVDTSTRRCTIVAVDTVWVAAVMHSVVRGSVQNPLQRAQSVNHLRETAHGIVC